MAKTEIHITEKNKTTGEVVTNLKRVFNERQGYMFLKRLNKAKMSKIHELAGGQGKYMESRITYKPSYVPKGGPREKTNLYKFMEAAHKDRLPIETKVSIKRL